MKEKYKVIKVENYSYLLWNKYKLGYYLEGTPKFKTINKKYTIKEIHKLHLDKKILILNKLVREDYMKYLNYLSLKKSMEKEFNELERKIERKELKCKVKDGKI